MNQKLKNTATLLYMLSLGLIAFGIITMVYYPIDMRDSIDMIMGDTAPTFNHFVEGDAYNLIIAGLRGLGYIVLGGFSGLFAMLITLFGLRKEQKTVIQWQFFVPIILSNFVEYNIDFNSDCCIIPL